LICSAKSPWSTTQHSDDVQRSYFGTVKGVGDVDVDVDCVEGVGDVDFDVGGDDGVGDVDFDVDGDDGVGDIDFDVGYVGVVGVVEGNMVVWSSLHSTAESWRW